MFLVSWAIRAYKFDLLASALLLHSCVGYTVLVVLHARRYIVRLRNLCYHVVFVHFSSVNAQFISLSFSSVQFRSSQFISFRSSDENSACKQLIFFMAVLSLGFCSFQICVLFCFPMRNITTESWLMLVFFVFSSV